MDGQGGLTTALRSEDLDDTAFGITTHTQAPDRGQWIPWKWITSTCLDGIISHAHDGTLTKGLLHLVHRELKGFQLLLVHLG
jgi:hypothetical protein